MLARTITPLSLAAIVAIAAIVVRSLTAAPAPAQAVIQAVGDADLCPSVHDAYLSGAIYGGLDRQIEWRGTDMSCTGGLRPRGDGVRLVFAAPGGQDGDRLVFVIGIAGAISDLTTSERLANVTVIDESSGRFFSSGGQERCWTTVASVDDDGRLLRIAGRVYCTGSLPSVSDSGSVTLRDFRYSGRLSVDAS